MMHRGVPVEGALGFPPCQAPVPLGHLDARLGPGPQPQRGDNVCVAPPTLSGASPRRLLGVLAARLLSKVLQCDAADEGRPPALGAVALGAVLEGLGRGAFELGEGLVDLKVWGLGFGIECFGKVCSLEVDDDKP